MIIKTDSKGTITSYATTGGIVGGIEIDGAVIPVDFEEDFYPRKWVYDGTSITLSGEPKPEPPAPPPDYFGFLAGLMEGYNNG